MEILMRKLVFLSALCCIASATVLDAQPDVPRRAGPPDGRPGGGVGAMGNTAQFLLSHTGDLRLTDAQVVRLAAIARRTDERMRNLRASMDSVRPTRRGPAGLDSTARAELRRRAEQMRPALDRARDQMQTDRRDAIAVLTPDQQGQAWDLVATRSRAARFDRGPGNPGMGGRGRAFGRMGGGPDGPGFRPRRNDGPQPMGPGGRGMRRPDGQDGPAGPPRLNRRRPEEL
jgi:Spy/CpxP family protein refolding chaperone